MSASKKLRALGCEPTEYTGISSERPAAWTLMDALPQIMAVVEDYEKLQGRHLGLLAALEQALTNPQGKD